MQTNDKVGIGLHTTWTIKERQGGLWVPVARRHNLHTNFGLTAYAGGFQGSYTAPTYMVVDTNVGTQQNVIGAAGGTSVVLDKLVNLAGDTQLVLGVGLGTQETVTFSGYTGTGPYTYTVSPTANAHAAGEWVTRAVLATDAMSSVISELQYDATNAPNQRMQSVGGYSSGTGNWIMQFFFTGTQALANFITLGLADNVTIGQGSLHNHLTMGYAHTSGNDLEIDVSLQLSNV